MRIGALTLRILRQFIHDKRTMALMFAAPLLVLSLMSLVFGGDAYKPNIGVTGQAALLSEALAEHDAQVMKYSAEEEGVLALKNGEIDALVSMDGGTPKVLLEGSNPTANRAVMLVLEQAVGNQQPAGQAQAQGNQAEGNRASAHSPAQPQISYLYGSADMKTIDRFGPIMIGVFVFFFVFLIAGVSFLRERTTGTLERLLATPLKRWEIVVGYVCGFGIFTVFQALLISWFSIQVLGIMMAGSFGYVLLITLLLSMTALTLGTLLSAYAGNELQMIQFIPLVIVPQIFLSGLFPLDTLPQWLQRIGYATPLYYGAEAMMNIMIRGKGWNAIGTDVYVLIAFSLLFMILNVLALRKHRKM
ncbi:ABC-2 type transport system permease protein [Paenibacillus forsythiae]|uniref:ABC-2 type transport system permease protein n=1 Tax=Paenibacillus forsythiae TaxID=365616 RepID=A0ABU3HDF7_9BACL|nr:ABC transporter permease [Paenibacillus forsythiae]MDT3428845.1 ABC-2 type transport system permease protein [Paenibacillus forsythiae]